MLYGRALWDCRSDWVSTMATQQHPLNSHPMAGHDDPSPGDDPDMDPRGRSYFGEPVHEEDEYSIDDEDTLDQDEEEKEDPDGNVAMLGETSTTSLSADGSAAQGPAANTDTSIKRLRRSGTPTRNWKFRNPKYTIAALDSLPPDIAARRQKLFACHPLVELIPAEF